MSAWAISSQTMTTRPRPEYRGSESRLRGSCRHLDGLAKALRILANEFKLWS